MSKSNIVHRVPLRIAVVGGGAAGLACAEALILRGARVSLFEAGRVGQGALAASGGMLAAGFETAFEAPPGPAFPALAHAALERWDAFAARVGAAGYEKRGSITPVYDREGLERLEQAAIRARQAGFEARTLTAAQAARAEPGLAPPHGGLEFPGDGQVDNRALGAALAYRLARLDVALTEQTPVKAVEPAGEGVILHLDSGELRFDAVVLATGSVLPEGLRLPANLVSPVKGQMIAFDLPREAGPDRIVRGLDIYLAAKPGGRLIAGATSEPGKAGLETNDAAIEALAARARAALPVLENRPVAERWAGLRPASPDLLPVLGPAGDARIQLALGGYRNGVLFAPAIGEAVAASLIDGALPDYASALTLARFGPAG